jgi:uroporphyrinogen decarboxylase
LSPPLVEAARGLATEQTPVWVMRQAGRYLPEYRELRKRVPFQKAVATPEVAAEITIQPIERFAMDGAVIFADIMTPLEAMGVDIEFDPGPKLRPHTLREVVDLPELKTERVSFVAETIRLVRQAVPAGIAVIGFAGAPLTLLAYLMEGGGSKDYMTLRAGLRQDPDTAAAALHHLARSMAAYLAMQVDAGADVVQLFDSWAGIVDRLTYADLIAPAASAVLSSQRVPTIYFAPHSPHTLDLQAAVGADVYGVDWRLPLDQAWDRIGAGAIQGNLDPAVLLSDPDKIATAVEDVMSRAKGRSGHIFNLGHGIHADTPPENLAAMVEAVRG